MLQSNLDFSNSALPGMQASSYGLADGPVFFFDLLLFAFASSTQ